MLPASNRLSGNCFAFPDVCDTPTPAGPVPIPYPNTAQNMEAASFATRVLICGGNAFNMASVIPMTHGDERGCADDTFMQCAIFTSGSPKVIIEGTPAVNLGCTTFQNRDNSVGSQIVPSATNVFYTYAQKTPEQRMTASDVLVMDDALHTPEGKLSADFVAEGIAILKIPIFASDVPARASAAIEKLRMDGARALILDLRGNPGGDVLAAIDFVSEFLPEGNVIAKWIDADGDETVHRSFNAEPNAWPMVVLVDRFTASAAEVVAGALRTHGRAVLLGEKTYGKGTVQAFVGAMAGPAYESIARMVLPDGTNIQGVGIPVDTETLGDGIFAVAIEVFKRQL